MKQLLHQARYEQIVFWRNRSGVFFTFAFPLMLLLLLGLFVGNSSETHDYGRFLVPGIAAMGITSVAFQTLAIAVPWHRELGILKTFAATPMPPIVLMLAKFLSVVAVALLEVALIVLVGSLVFDLALPYAPIAFFAWTLLGVATMSAVGLALAQLIPSGDSAPAITNAVYLPVVFVSGVFYSVDKLPAWGQIAANILPLHHLVEPVRASYLGEGTALGWPVHLAILVGWTALGLVVAVSRFRWEPRHASA